MSKLHPLELFLARLVLRSALTNTERLVVLELPHERVAVKASHDFVAFGAETRHACLIATGVAGRFEQLRDGTRHITALHLPGDMADLHSVAIPKTSWALHSLSQVTILRVPHTAIRAAADRFPNLAMAFWRDCVVDASILAQRSVSLGRRRAVARVAHLICELACRYDRCPDPGPTAFPLAMTQAHLADLLGLTSVHVNRMIRELRMLGLAEVGGREIRILDWSGLIALSDFDPSYLHLDDGTETGSPQEQEVGK